MLGDVNLDGAVTIQDAYEALLVYSSKSAGKGTGLIAVQEMAADVDGDDALTINNVYRILLYYATASAGKTPTWESINAM